jgi:hypothetical protein
MEENEEWRPVVGFEDCYDVSNLGRVRRTKYWKPYRREPGLVRPGKNGEGYMLVQLCRLGVRKMAAVHQLVMAAFVGPCPPRMQVNHKDDNKQNNCLANLTYGTSSENRRQACAKRKAFPPTRLKEADIRAIRQLQGQVRVVEIAERFGVNRKTIYGILRRENWAHVA